MEMMKINPNNLDNIIKDMVDEIDKEVDLEDGIKDIAESIAKRLEQNNRTQEEVNGKKLMFSYVNTGKVITLAVANLNKYKLVPDKYVPYICNAEVNNDLSLYENLSATVEMFIRHISGLDNVTIEDDGPPQSKIIT